MQHRDSSPQQSESQSTNLLVRPDKIGIGGAVEFNVASNPTLPTAESRMVPYFLPGVFAKLSNVQSPGYPVDGRQGPPLSVEGLAIPAVLY